MTAIEQIARAHFGARNVKGLERKGVRLVALQAIPGEGDLPYANAQTGYVVDDNGTARVLTILEVMQIYVQP